MKALKDFRTNLNLTQSEMASKMEVSLSYYIKVEQDTAKAGRGFIESFRQAFPNESTDIFFGGDDDDKDC